MGYIGINQAPKQFAAARKHLRGTPLGEFLEWAVNDPNHRVDIIKYDGIPRKFFEQTNYRGVIYWNPSFARTTNDGRAQSPAVVIGHEAAHAYRAATDLAGYKRDLYKDWTYGNREERRVITGPETETAKTLGEGIRTDGNGRFFPVPSVDSIGGL